MVRLTIAPLLLLSIAAAAEAHPAPFSFIDVRLNDAGLDGSVVVHDLDVAHELGIHPPSALLTVEGARAARDRVVALLGSRLELLLDRQPVAIDWGAIDPLRERQSLRLGFSVRAPRPATLHVRAALFPYDPVHQTFVNVYEQGELRQQAILDLHRHRVTHYAGSLQGRAAVLGTFLVSGIEHILIGPDHLLFLAGLLLLGGPFWRLATIVTAFTAGHSVTLSLATLQVVTPPARIVEPAIALSIILIGLDNLLILRTAAAVAGSQTARDIRAWVAAGFGLVHGFGFATVLREIGMPDSAVGLSLFSFNLGVELGQLAAVVVIASALAAVRWRSAAASRRIAQAGSAAVIVAGSFWFVERTFLTGGGP